MEISLENLYVDTGALRVEGNWWYSIIGGFVSLSIFVTINVAFMTEFVLPLLMCHLIPVEISRR